MSQHCAGSNGSNAGSEIRACRVPPRCSAPVPTTPMSSLLALVASASTGDGVVIVLMVPAELSRVS
jgi:hypothetical protein